MKYLMIVVILFEELLGNFIRKINLNDNWPYLFIFSSPILVLYYLSVLSITAMQVTTIIFIAAFCVTILIMLMDSEVEKNLLMVLGSFSIIGIIMSNSVSTEIISTKKDVVLTKNIVKYKGFKKDVSCIIKKCVSHNYTIQHNKKTLFDITQEGISVDCNDLVQEIQEV